MTTHRQQSYVNVVKKRRQLPEMDCDAASSYRNIRKSQDLDFHRLLEKLNLLNDEHLTVVVHRLDKSSLLFQG